MDRTPLQRQTIDAGEVERIEKVAERSCCLTIIAIAAAALIALIAAFAKLLGL